MKKIAPVVIILLFVLLVWNVFGHPFGMDVDLDGERFDGPVGALIGLLFAGGGIVVAALVMVFVGALLALVFAGVGLLLTLGLGMGAVLVALAISPLLLPLLVPLAIIWFFMHRARRSRVKAQAV
jgi:hypothetical protein